MRVYSVFAILFFLFGSIAVVIGGPPLVVGYEWGDPAFASITRAFRIAIIFLFGAGLIISVLLFFIIRRRGFVAYNRIIERLSSERSMNFSLNIKFPETDEFGNLGKWLNSFIEQMREFDQIKVERLRTSQQKIAALSEMMGKGIMILSSENKVTYVNSDVIKSLNLGEKTVAGLPINKVMENEELENTLIDLKEKPKNKVLEDLRIKSGENVYKAKLNIIPIISSEVNLMETMIVFDYISKKVLNI
jgi:signal transduction histidine kinase